MVLDVVLNAPEGCDIQGMFTLKGAATYDIDINVVVFKTKKGYVSISMFADEYDARYARYTRSNPMDWTDGERQTFEEEQPSEIEVWGNQIWEEVANEEWY